MQQPILSTRVRLILLMLFVLLPTLAVDPLRAAQQGPSAQVGEWLLSSVSDWDAGMIDGLLVINNAGGELRLAEDRTSGSFVSAPFNTPFAVNALGASWEAEIATGSELRLELRARSSAPDGEEGWGAWQPLIAGETRSAKDEARFASPDVLAIPANSSYLQLRATFGATAARASATLADVSVAFLRTAQSNPVFAAGLPRQPILFGPTTLTARPSQVTRAVWSGKLAAPLPERANPRGIVLHQLNAAPAPDATLDLLRAQLLYQTDVLGFEDLSYHYLIDPEGIIYEGRSGGPTVRAPRFSAGGDAVQIALIAPASEAPSNAAQSALIGLLAWLGQAYTIVPTGEHSLLLDGERVSRPNVVGHNEIVDAAPDPFPPFRSLLPELRNAADRSTVRARWYFAEGNVADYSVRFSFFNPTGAAADARVTLLRPGAPISQIIDVPANGRADFTVNDILADETTLPAVVESSAPILVERAMNLTTDIDGGPGIQQLSRSWFFAEGSTAGDRRTYLVLFNPQTSDVPATITYMGVDGAAFSQEVQIPAGQRLVVSVYDILPNRDFGMRVIAAQPIAVERTMRFGAPVEGRSPGLHTGRGIQSLARRWYFAEGTTQAPFEMELLVLNPNEQATNATVTLLGPDGTSEVRRYAIAPRAQLAINVNDVVPNLGVSTVVEADRAVAVERALYFNNGAAGTISVGATAPAYTWRFVEGRTNGADYFLLFSNPQTTRAIVTVDFVFGDGARASERVEVPAQSRYTLAVHDIFPNEGAVSATVRSSQAIIAERSLFPTGTSGGGATVIGIPE